MVPEPASPTAPRKPFPKLRYHKGTRRFFVDWQGSWRYWPTGTSKTIAQADYDAMQAAYEAGREVVPPGAERTATRTIDTLIDAYLAHCDVYYANSKATIGNIERAMLPLHEQFGRRPLDGFGPRMLRDLREDMVRDGFSRKVINARVQMVVRMFKWAVAEELVPAAIYESLRAVEGLRIGRTPAPEGPGRRPVPWEHVEPVLAHVAREVAAMLVIQAESGARPGEVVQMRAGDLDRSGKVWTYKPRRHKTQHLGKTRLVPLFERAQEALLPFLQRVPPLGPDEFVFSPQRAESARRLVQRQNRKTRVQPSQQAREARPLDERERPPRDGYDVNTYARAVRRGIEAANTVLLRDHVAAAVLPLHEECHRDRAAKAIAALPIRSLRMVLSTDAKVLAAEERRLRRALRRGFPKGKAVDEVIEGLLAAAKAAVEQAKAGLIPYWSPYQLRHRFATVGEERFGEAAVSLAMGHASLRMTEHYIERNLKAVFERMARDAT
ncbi:MAG: hypothetical protein U1F36_22400 [Planctomycetota bacterium]